MNLRYIKYRCKILVPRQAFFFYEITTLYVENPMHFNWLVIFLRKQRKKIQIMSYCEMCILYATVQLYSQNIINNNFLHSPYLLFTASFPYIQLFQAKHQHVPTRKQNGTYLFFLKFNMKQKQKTILDNSKIQISAVGRRENGTAL